MQSKSPEKNHLKKNLGKLRKMTSFKDTYKLLIHHLLLQLFL